MKEHVYTVKGIHCTSCVALISESVEGVAGVAGVDVDRSAERVVVSGDGFDDDAVRGALAATGYEASP